jgi:hypothetical protein
LTRQRHWRRAAALILLLLLLLLLLLGVKLLRLQQ